MTGTALDHPLVRDYLRELDTAFAALPAGQASELREQIVAHLDDALRPGADDQEVAGVLGRLGPPGDLAAEAAAGAAPGERAAGTRRRFRPHRLGRRAGALAIAAVAVAGLLASYFVAARTAAPLRTAGASSWWYARDWTRAVDTSADGYDQTTVPIRSGQRQGFVISIYNPSRWTQTILGPGAGFLTPNGPYGQLGVGDSLNIRGGGSIYRPATYVLPGTIPPHQIRALRVMWTSTACLQGDSFQGIVGLSLRVRVGWITRTEVVRLNQGWYLSGPSQGRCT
jgi:hypothetical protein